MQFVRRSGKTAYMMQRMLEAVRQSHKVAFVSYNADGEPHVCTVYPFRRPNG